MSDSVKAYLNEIARFPLLTPLQEIELARQIEAGAALEGKEDLTSAQRRIKARAKRAKDTLINANLRLVVFVAKKYMRKLRGNSMELMDLVQEGAQGLMRAVELFDSTKGYKFSTYAYWWIRQAITRGIDTRERLIRLPQHGVDVLYKILKYQKTYFQEHGKNPTYRCVAEYLDLEEDYVRLLITRGESATSLDALAVDGGSTFLDFVPDESAHELQLEFMEKDERAAMLDLALSCLQDAELQTVKLRYGLTGEPPMTLSALAKIDGVSRERIRQRIQAAHIKMRLQLKNARYA